MKIRSVCSAAATLVLAASAFAQPACTSLGTLSNPSTTTGTVTIPVAGTPGTQWLCFDLPTIDRAAGHWLDIDTNGAGAGNPSDTEIGLYRADGTLVTSNDDSGPGAFSMLSFGDTTPTRPGLAFVAPATTVGSAHAGASGALLPAGTYYLAIGVFNVTFGTTAFTVTSTGTATGNVAYRIDIGTDAAPAPLTCALAVSPTSSFVGGTFVARATVTPGTFPSSTGIAVSLNATNVDGGTVTLLDDGIAPDVTAGDRIYSGNVTVGAGAVLGAQALTATVTDLETRSSTCNATVTIVPPPPANDECAGAFTAMTGSNSYDTAGALTSSANGSPCGAIGTDVWFVWNSGSGGNATIATCGQTTVDTVLAVYANCGATTAIACSDDGCSAQSTVTFCAAASTDYYIRIGDFAGGNPHAGTFSIAVDTSGTPTATVAASPACGGEGTAVTITSRLNNAGCPAQTVTSASADASAINGGTVTLLDDGVAPDVTAADGIFTGSTTVGAGAASGDIVVTTNYSGGGNSSNNIAFVVPAADDTGDTLATAARAGGAVAGQVAISTITGTVGDLACGGNDADMWLIRICDPTTFGATAVGGVAWDTQLFLFNNQGVGVAFNDDSTGLQSTLTSTFTAALVPGDFYLALSPYSKDPLDASAAELWLDSPFGTERAPDGAGAANPVASWNNDNFNTGGPYSLALTGVCASCHGTCLADYDDGSAAGIPDGGVTIDDLLYYLFIFEAGDLCADVDDGSSTGAQDGGVTIDDLLYYLFRFESGC